jgi:hydroxymethylpyrimidine/phosphomethylpyrimidine kinase
LVAYMPNLSWVEEDDQQAYLDAFRELVLPQAEVLVGNHQTLTDCLLPDWESERAPSARELAVAANALGAQYVLVTGIQLPDQFIDNVLAGPQGALAGERFERFDTSFVGAGDTLSAALAAILATTEEVDAAVSEALSFLDQALDSGFRPGMGGVIPDRFFWALPPDEAAAEALAEGGAATELDDTIPPTHSRHVH